MADLSIGIEILGIDKASGVFGGVQKGVGGLLGGFKDLGLGVLGIGAAFDAGKSAIEGLIGPAIEAQQVASQTAAVLKSTGEAAGLSIDDISGLAGSLSKLTPFEDEAIQGAENLLLTFTNIGKDVFPDATETVLNMSQALGQDLKSSSVQLGKALNDPIKGISALSRVGVAFTAEQKDQIKVLQDSGDMMGAQKIILAELEKEFGGAAKAAGQTFGGQLVILQTAVGNVAEAIGGPLIKALSGAAQAVLPFVQSFADELPAAIDDFMAVAAPAFEFLGSLLAELGDAVEPLVAIFTDTFQAIGLIAEQAMTGDVASALENVLSSAQVIGLRLGDVLTEWGAAFVAWIAPIIPPLLRELLDLVIQIDTWIVQTGLPMLVTQLADWAGAFVDWVAPLIPPLLRELGSMLLQVGSWMLNTALPAMAGNLLKWGLAFVEWVAPRIPLLMGEIMKLELELLGWMVTQALPAIIGKLAEWGLAFVDWVTKPLQELPGRLALLLNAISEWITNSLNTLTADAGRMGAAFIQGIQDGISGAIGDFKTWLTDNVINAIPEWIRGILNLNADSGTMAQIGARMIEEMEIGIRGRMPSLEKLIQFATERIGSLGGGMGGSVDGWLAAAMGITGVGADWLPGLRKLVSLESSGNPGAVNPIEVLGQHATGLLQMLPSTFQAHLLDGLDDILNPIHNAVSSIRYIQSHPSYGHVDNIPGVSDGREFQGYAEGGIVPGPPGMGQWAWVHGAERITPPGQSGGVTNIFNFPNYLGSRDELVRQIDSGLAVMKGRNGRLAFER